jgi:hypothetical protein
VSRRSAEALSKPEIIRCLIGGVWVWEANEKGSRLSVSAGGRPRCLAV